MRDWAHRFNEQGLAGLSDKTGGVDPKPLLSPEQEREVAEWVRHGPDLAEHGVIRWHRADLARAIAAKFGVVLAERSRSDVLRLMGFRRLVARPRRRSASVFQSNFAALVDEALPEHARGKPLEIWWQEEARIGQQGTLTRVWAERGSRPSAPRDRRYDWAYIFGAICPARGIRAALVLAFANAEMMNLHLAEISAH